MKIKFLFRCYNKKYWWCGNPNEIKIHYGGHTSCSTLLKEHQSDSYYSETLKRFLNRLVKYENNH